MSDPDVKELSAAHEVLVRCAWCERIKLDDAWIEVAEANAMRLTSDNFAHRSHGICPDCFAKLTP